MRKIRINAKKRKTALCLGAVAALPALYLVATLSLPFLSPVFEKAALWSASLSFFSFGDPQVSELLPGNINLSDVKGNNDSETEDIPYEDPQVSSQAQTSIPDPGKKPADAGVVTRKTFPSGTTGHVNVDKVSIKNSTSLTAGQVTEIVKSKPAFKITADGKPEVLIMHTHTTEGYQPTQAPWFDKKFNSRTTDLSKSVVRVGDEIEKQLVAAGIGVLHDTTLHDYPSYNGSYERSAVTVKDILKKNPSIKVVLDVHRDAIQPDAGNITAPATTINGKSAAQVMIISGADNGEMNMPKYKENLKFSAALQQQMGVDYPTLARPILFDYRKYNQDLTTGSILLEMGGHANSLDEAIYCGELVGKSLAKTLVALK